jgi:hypothetical protein
MSNCSCCFFDTLAKCQDEIVVNIQLPVYGEYRWVITDKFGNKYEGAFLYNDDGQVVIPVADLPEGLLTQYSGKFTLQIVEAGTQACAPVQFLAAGKYDCIEFEITGGDYQKNNLGCELP